MSPGELVWRVRSVARDAVDRIRFPAIRASADQCAWADEFEARGPEFRIAEVAPGAWSAAPPESCEAQWVLRLRECADRLCGNRLSFFDQTDVSMGTSIDWNRDVKNAVRAPLLFAPGVDYRDVRRNGDCKFVWEPNRHHQLVVLGRAYRATGDVRYAKTVAAQLESWLDACPFGLGMNWRSGLELAIRLINWVWVLDLIGPARVVGRELQRRILRSVELHVWEIRRKYSAGSSANNHLIGEAAGVFVAASYFTGLPNRRTLAAEAKSILEREIESQTHDDGGTREQALGYQMFVMGLLLAAGSAGSATGDSFRPSFWRRMRAMAEFLESMCPQGNPLALYGDADDGYALDLNGSPRACRTILEWVAVFGGDLHARDGELSHWLPRAAFGSAPELAGFHGATAPVRSRQFAESGYVLLANADSDSRNQASLLFDCGELGYGALAAHGHADALSFTLRAFGKDVFVDPGTYDYFTYPQWRQYFRGTRAHNTIMVDDLDQSEMLGLFLWGKRANVRLIDLSLTADGGCIVAEHDGYQRLSDPVTHRRTMTLSGRRRLLTISDEIDARGAHDISIHFHIGEGLRVSRSGERSVVVDAGDGRIELRLDPRLELALVTGGEDPIIGWISRGYHRKTPITTVVGRCRGEGRLRLFTEIMLLPGGAEKGGLAGHASGVPAAASVA